jgi:hypothetical protein
VVYFEVVVMELVDVEPTDDYLGWYAVYVTESNLRKLKEDMHLHAISLKGERSGRYFFFRTEQARLIFMLKWT